MMTSQTSKEKKFTRVAVSLALPLMLTYPQDSTVVMRYNSHMQTRQEVTKKCKYKHQVPIFVYRRYYNTSYLAHKLFYIQIVYMAWCVIDQRYASLSIQCLEIIVVIQYTMHFI